MPYPAGHRERVRERIVDSARRLFNRNGFDGVSVDAIMADAGLTRGAFYSYFDGKSDLYAEVLGCFFTDPHFRSRWEGVEVDLASAEAGPQIVLAYLSRRHFEKRGGLVSHGGAARRRGAQRCACEDGVREGLSRDGVGAGRRGERESAPAGGCGDGHCGSLRGRHGGGEIDGRPGIRRSAARSGDASCIGAGRLEARREDGGREWSIEAHSANESGRACRGPLVSSRGREWALVYGRDPACADVLSPDRTGEHELRDPQAPAAP